MCDVASERAKKKERERERAEEGGRQHVKSSEQLPPPMQHDVERGKTSKWGQKTSGQVVGGKTCCGFRSLHCVLLLLQTDGKANAAADGITVATAHTLNTKSQSVFNRI
jgi:hypothetical protein